MTGCGHWIKAGAWISTTLVFVGCGSESPPYDELPLRDALRAAPEVVASLSFETRYDLARRLDSAGFERDGATTFTLPEAVTIESLARVADEAREDLDQDALILAEVVETPSDFVLQGGEIDAESLDRVMVGPVLLRGRPSTQTAALEDVALRGRAGKWLRELSGRTDATHMVRATGLPFGAWAHDDTLYVNASWLVAMSALEKDGAVTGPVSASIEETIQTPPKTPLSIDYNPYNLPDSLAQCAQQVLDTCQCGTSCTHEVTDPSFANANDECAWVNQNPSHPAALCVLALMSIDDVRACMESGGSSCSALPVTSGNDALIFVQNQDCMDFLDTCLRDGYIPRSSGSSSCNDGNSSSGGSNNSCKSCNDDCSDCNDNCSDCNNNWSDCNDNCSNSNSNCGNSGSNVGGCGKCSVKPASGRSPVPAPWGTTLWLLAPAAYVLLRSRRRS